MERDLRPILIQDLKSKMVLLSGPRQVGKTWLAKQLMSNFSYPVYLNYDHSESREVIKGELWPERTDFLILDELHKMPKWKNYLKGAYDTKPPHLSILVTGSARLDTFTKSGDSLAGRFFRHRLLPFSPKELVGKSSILLDSLMERSGFPEPLLSDSPSAHRRWRQNYANSLIRVDILNFENLGNMRAMNMLFELLRERVGSNVSYSSLGRDLKVSYQTVKKYIEVLEALYVVFRVTPFSKNIGRALSKEPKLYFFDTGLVRGGEGPQFENLIALALKKEVLAAQDQEGRETTLHYIRTKDKEEIDFALAEEGNLRELIESKVRSRRIPKTLHKYVKRLKVPATLVVKELKVERQEDTISVRRAALWLRTLKL
jgi:uncharacterized protein